MQGCSSIQDDTSHLLLPILLQKFRLTRHKVAALHGYAMPPSPLSYMSIPPHSDPCRCQRSAWVPHCHIYINQVTKTKSRWFACSWGDQFCGPQDAKPFFLYYPSHRPAPIQVGLQGMPQGSGLPYFSCSFLNREEREPTGHCGLLKCW